MVENFDGAGPPARKIGYLVPQFPGQTHIFFWREIIELERRGVQPVLFSTTPPPKGLISHAWSEEAMARTEYLGRADLLALTWSLPRAPWAEIAREIRAEGRAFARDVLICLPAARRLIRACRAQGIGHVHAHSCGRAALIAALAQRMGGPSYSLTLHGPMSDYGPGQRFKWRGARFATIITEKLLAEVTRDLAGDLPLALPVQAMGVDVETFAPDGPYRPASANEPLRIFACGRLHVVKGHQDLMQAVRLLLDRGVDVQLEIAGEDDHGGSGYHGELQAVLGRLNLQGHARLLGAVSAERVKAGILDAHAFVLASWHEPLGVAYMEAMACGTPTIGTDAGGVPELIRDGVDGLLVPPKDPEALAEALLRLRGDPDLAHRLSQGGRQRIVDHFSAATGAETLIAHWP
ncbi:exopolysaccharide biosynthesis GT4 family glycosyltransferase EpsE [Mesobacterium pallidum]|uniref:exopolysaccharide biosynthesis GT4 family glycosyltransferase EpsE n=1 Tax=Mesobacterium pallidum TaxID=2872037 RepID=UPI001EE2F950|nr:exopolysaccharide biosynthesis GT4 family glycosyltransferase EpsE [Mesobacterium pallidum]